MTRRVDQLQEDPPDTVANYRLQFIFRLNLDFTSTLFRIMPTKICIFFMFSALFLGCQKHDSSQISQSSNQLDAATCAIDANGAVGKKTLDEKLPSIGVILFKDVLMTEVTAPVDVFSKLSEDGKQLFNVFTIAQTTDPVVCESGLRILPDFTFETCPKLDVLVVPSSYDMTATAKDAGIVAFIKQQNENTQFTMSNCAGAQLIGESGIANGKKIVTYIGGGKELQQAYPALAVQDDETVSYVEDGKFLSSNGNLASYISALELVEKMTNRKHREFIESYLYLERLKNWNE